MNHSEKTINLAQQYFSFDTAIIGWEGYYIRKAFSEYKDDKEEGKNATFTAQSWIQIPESSSKLDSHAS